MTCSQLCPHTARDTMWPYNGSHPIVMSKEMRSWCFSKRRICKEGSTLQETKTAIKTTLNSKWLLQHAQRDKTDSYYLLSWQEQVTIFRLRTGHNRLNQHLYHKYRMRESPLCPCGSANQITEHLLQICPLQADLRCKFWKKATLLATMLYGSLEDLRCMLALSEEDLSDSLSEQEEKRTQNVKSWLSFDRFCSLWWKARICLILTFFSFLEWMTLYRY